MIAVKRLLSTVFLLFNLVIVYAQNRQPVIKENVDLDSIRLSDPFILADKNTSTYYMTGTGGLLWKSKDLKKWTGPFVVAKTDSTSWMGAHPMIWAAEIHYYKGRYYYFATFTNRNVKIDTVKGNVIERRACHVLVSDKAEGPYIPFGDPVYLPANKPTLDATFWIDNDGKPYMIYCHEWLQNWNGTVEKIEEKDENGNIVPNKVTDGPFLFRTQTGKLGMIWTSWVFDVYTQGVAYSQSGTLNGSWIQEKVPVTPPDFGHGMLFRTFEGKLLMVLHRHKNVNGRYIRVPHLFEVDDSGDKIIVGKPFN